MSAVAAAAPRLSWPPRPGGPVDDAGAELERQRHRAVAAAAVRDDQLVGHCQGRGQIAAQGVLLVQGGHHDRQSHRVLAYRRQIAEQNVRRRIAS